jgi:hypothetical protein
MEFGGGFATGSILCNIGGVGRGSKNLCVVTVCVCMYLAGNDSIPVRSLKYSVTPPRDI